MVNCDFCALSFHLDCCDASLTAERWTKERWMCPLHVEPFLDKYFVSSMSMCERLRIWKEHARQRDVDTFSIGIFGLLRRNVS